MRRALSHTSVADLGGGFRITRDKVGAAVWWIAQQVDADGYVIRSRRYLATRRDAEAAIRGWRLEDAAGQPSIPATPIANEGEAA